MRSPIWRDIAIYFDRPLSTLKINRTISVLQKRPPELEKAFFFSLRGGLGETV